MASRSGRVYKHIEALGGFRSFRHYFSTGRLPKLDIVPQLTYYNANDCEMEDWMVSRRYADKCEFLYKVTPGRLIRQCDWDLEPRYMQAVPGIMALKEGVSIVAYNLYRGRNIGHLLTDDNILLTPFGSMMLKETCLPGEMEGPENNHMAFRKLHDWYFGECGHTGLLARSMGEQLTDQVLPPELIDIRRLLKSADLVDKRRITNHTAQMLREERTEQIWDMSHFLRNRNVYMLTVPPGSSYTASARSIHVALGKLVPGGVKGIHPMMDHWVNHSRFLGKQIILSQGAEFTVDVIGDDEENGRLLVAVVRFSIEHPGGPNIARFKKKMANSYSNEHELDQIVPIPGYYTVNEVAEMRDFKLPLFGCTGLEAFLKCNLGKHAGIPTSVKTCHLRWNDLDETNSPQIFSR